MRDTTINHLPNRIRAISFLNLRLISCLLTSPCSPGLAFSMTHEMCWEYLMEWTQRGAGSFGTEPGPNVRWTGICSEVERVSDPGYSALSEEKHLYTSDFLTLSLSYSFLPFLPYHLHSFLSLSLSLSHSNVWGRRSLNVFEKKSPMLTKGCMYSIKM